MANWLRILHMSDLHERVALDWMNDERKAKVRGGKASRYRVLGSKLIDALEEIRKKHAIDIVCFTGDVADWGLAEEYKQATNRLDSILRAAGVSRERLFLVPGNHDVNRKLAEDTWTEMRKLVEKRIDLSHWMAGQEPPYGARSDWREDILKRTAAFWQWVDEDLGLGVLSPKNNPHGRLGYCFPIKSLGLSFPLYIIGLDSAWLAGNHDTGELLLTRRQIDLLTTDEGGNTLPGLRLALVHHSLTSLSDHGDSFNLLADSVDLLLHGHQHRENIQKQTDPDRQLDVFSAGSLYEGDEEDKHINGFHVLDIQTNDEGRPLGFEIEFWGWAENGFWYRTGANYEAARDGRYKFFTDLGRRVLPLADQKVRTAPDHLQVPYRNPAFLDTDFKDRVEQRDNTVRLLGDDNKRLICIFGHPGMGKTYLAAKVLWDIENSCKAETNSPLNWDGIVYLSIEDLTFDNLFDRIRDVCSDDAQKDLDAVRRSNVGTERKISKLMEVLDKGRYIILMDGIETLLNKEGKFDTERGKARDLSQFCKRALESASESKIILTCTQRFTIDDVRLWPRIHEEQLLLGLPKKDAIARLRELDPPGTSRLKNASDEQLAGIVKATHGIPRALELVARILAKNESSLQDIAARFFEIQEVVNTLVEETYTKLDAVALRIVEALAVFDRPVHREAICFVLQKPLNDSEIQDTIKGLHETHLINSDWKDVETQLFSLHPIEQSYTYCHIPEKDVGHNRKEMHLLVADYYVTLRRSRKEWKDVKQDIEPQLLEFDQRIRAEDYDGAAQVMDTIDYSWSNHHKYLAYLMFLGYGSDSIKRREELLGKLSSKLEVHNRTSLGWVCRRMGRKKEAEKHLAMAVEQARAGDDAGARIYALSELGYYLTDNAGRHDEAEMHLNEALQIARALADDYSQAHVLLGLAFADFQRPEPERNLSSLKNASQALKLFQQVPTQCARYREVDCWVRLGMTHRKTGDYPAAVLTAEKGLEVADKHGLVGWKGELNSGLGFHLRAQGKFEAAIKCHKEALNLFGQQCGMKREEAVQYSYLGNLYTDLGLFDDAKKSYEKAEDITKAIDLRRELSWIVSNRGVLYCRLGDYEKAYGLQQQALTIARENNHLDSQVVRFTDLSATLLAMGKPKEAEEALLNALQCAAQDGNIKLPLTLPEAYLESPYLEDKLPHEMQSPDDHLRRGTVLARIYLHSNDLAKALQVIQLAQTSQHDLSPHKHFSAVLHAIVLHRLGRFDEARIIYQRAVELANEIQLRTPQYYPAQYTHGLALAGLATLSKGQARDTVVRQAREAYQKALDMCKAAGVVDDAMSLLQEVPSEDELISLVFPKDYKCSNNGAVDS